jgi:manganese oxidase
MNMSNSRTRRPPVRSRMHHGPANITQPPIEPGGTYLYEFTAGQSGTYFYHSHDEPDRQQALGLYGALIIAPRDPTTAPPEADYDVVVQLQE